jgi:hypothetical protein
VQGQSATRPATRNRRSPRRPSLQAQIDELFAPRRAALARELAELQAERDVLVRQLGERTAFYRDAWRAAIKAGTC